MRVRRHLTRPRWALSGAKPLRAPACPNIRSMPPTALLLVGLAGAGLETATEIVGRGSDASPMVAVGALLTAEQLSALAARGYSVGLAEFDELTRGLRSRPVHRSSTSDTCCSRRSPSR